MPARVSVVIPNWNTRRFLGPCLKSLRGQTFTDFEVVLADNGSTDDSLSFAAENFPEVEAVALGENRGFSAAVNAGIGASDSEYVVLLNNDTEQDPAWLESLVRAADGAPEAGFFASKLLDFENRGVLDGAGDAIHWSGLTYRLGHGECDVGQYDGQGFVFGACAAAAMYRREIFENAGLFDEDFFAYCEDGDLSFRAQLAGYKCLYVPDAVVYHLGGASTGGKGSPTATRLGTRNSINLLVKNLPARLLPKWLPFIMAGQLLRVGMTASSPALLKAHLSGLRGAISQLPLMLRKRRAIQTRSKVPAKYVEKLLEDSSRLANASLNRTLRRRLKERWLRKK